MDLSRLSRKQLKMRCERTLAKAMEYEKKFEEALDELNSR